MQANLWNSLEILSTEAALMVEWQEALGEDFSSGRVFLRPTQQQSDSYPCIHPVPCSCRHRVAFESEDDVSALCDCGENSCEPILLGIEDLIIHVLDGGMVASALQRVLNLDEWECPDVGESRSRPVGTWGLRRSPVLFYVPISENGLLAELEELSAAMRNPFVLLTPTSRFCAPMVQRALRREGNLQISLCGLVALSGPGDLALLPDARTTIDTLLGDFGRRIAEGTPLERAIARMEEKLNAIAKSRTPQENETVSEEVARQAFALVKQLDSGQRMKEPSLVTVFRLYCIRELSAAQIAEQFGCSKTAIMKRLKTLADRIGMPPARLRKYSAQFERMEDELGDWRARRIDRHELAKGPDADENEMD